jgi:flagellar hook-associated protein 3 FlgL
MEIGPLLPGRFPSSLITDRIQSQMREAQQAMTILQDQISSGHRFFLPSDDPSSAVQTVGLQSLLERKTQMASNVATTQSLLSASEAAIASVADALNRAKQLSSAGVGDSSSVEEKAAMALEAKALIRQVVNAANSTFRGRYLFGGSEASSPPFALLDENAVRYEGDQLALDSYADLSLLQPSNVDGHAAFGALTAAIGSDINPALTLSTKLTDLFGGQGFSSGPIVITLSSPAQSQTIDLSQVRTVNDLKTVVENAFTPGSLTVSINATRNGILFTPTAGTIAIADVAGGNTAASLKLAATAAAVVNSGDLDPRLTQLTRIADLNGGTGIGATAGNGIIITNGQTTKTIDLSGAVTMEDLFNLLRDPALGVSAEINAAGNGLAIAGRLSGVSFSVGENNGQNATNLGIRTMIGSTLLADLNFGRGVPVDNGLPLAITRRDGTVANVNLSGSLTVQDVVNRINAVAPGSLVASLNAVGNGISLLDNSGTGPLSVDNGELGAALGLSGTEPGAVNTVPLVGRDANLREVKGGLNALIRLENALRNNDTRELVRINGLVDKELSRLTKIRGDIGGRLKTLDEVNNRLKDEDLQARQALSNVYDADLAEVLADLVARQTAFQATLRAAAQTLQLSLANFL